MKDKKILSHRLPETNQKVLYSSATLYIHHNDQ